MSFEHNQCNNPNSRIYSQDPLSLRQEIGIERIKLTRETIHRLLKESNHSLISVIARNYLSEEGLQLANNIALQTLADKKAPPELSTPVKTFLTIAAGFIAGLSVITVFPKALGPASGVSLFTAGSTYGWYELRKRHRRELLNQSFAEAVQTILASSGDDALANPHLRLDEESRRKYQQTQQYGLQIAEEFKTFVNGDALKETLANIFHDGNIINLAIFSSQTLPEAKANFNLIKPESDKHTVFQDTYFSQKLELIKESLPSNVEISMKIHNTIGSESDKFFIMLTFRPTYIQ